MSNSASDTRDVRAAPIGTAGDAISSGASEGDLEAWAPSGRPLRADARRNRERILEAALRVFAEQGIEAQITDVARDADVGVGTIYRHFPTKEALAAELVRHQFRVFAANARAALDRDGPPFEALAGVMRQNAELCARNVAIQSTLSSAFEQAWTLARDELGELHALTTELVERAQRAGEMRPDIRTDDIPMLMCGVSSTMANTGAPGFDWRRHLELVIDMLRGRHGES